MESVSRGAQQAKPVFASSTQASSAVPRTPSGSQAAQLNVLSSFQTSKTAPTVVASLPMLLTPKETHSDSATAAPIRMMPCWIHTKILATPGIPGASSNLVKLVEEQVV